MLLKLYVEEMSDPNTENTVKRAYQLQNIEKASVQGGGVQNSVPISLAPSTNAIRTVADLFNAVKEKDHNIASLCRASGGSTFFACPKKVERKKGSQETVGFPTPFRKGFTPVVESEIAKARG